MSRTHQVEKGESLSSIQQFDAPLARATTSSLDALHAYSLALDNGSVNPRLAAIPHLRRAVATLDAIAAEHVPGDEGQP